MTAFVQRFAVALVFSYIPLLAWTQQPKEPEWKPPLTSGGAPECPEHLGSRTHRSETISMDGVKAVIVGTTIRGQGKSCNYKADVEFSGKINGTLHLPDPGKQQFEIVDFSADGNKLLLSTQKEMEYPNIYRRYVEVASLELPNGQAHWVNVWDIFGWHECDATVEPQGYTQDGYVILRARPSVWVSFKNSRPDCVSNVGLYKTDLASPPVRLPDDTKISRLAKRVSEASQACKTDPDIIGACFTIHGRLSAWNGTPTLRIWRVGTKRILGTRDDPLPENLQKHMDWGVEAWGDFEVCPYTKEQPGVMQTVCVESATNVFYKSYPKP
jgi:hypothetical protein